MRLLIIRHGECELESGADPPLTARGREQAARLADALCGLALDRVVCSTMRRAVETAEAVARALGLAVAQEPALAEIDLGTLWHPDQQQAWDQICERWRAGDYAARCPQGESLLDVIARVRPVAARLLAEPWHHGLAVVAHAVVNGVLLALLCAELRPMLGHDLGHSYTGVWELEGDPGGLRALRRDDVRHLLPTDDATIGSARQA